MSRKVGKCTSLTAFIVVVSLFIQAFMPIHFNRAAASVQPDLKLEVSAAILIEAETGQILYEMNKDELRPPASMAKMMTEYVVLEEIISGRIRWEDTAVVSQYASRIGGSGGLLAAGETYTIEQLFKNMSIFSGNDASIVLAEYIAGSEEQFAHMMNDTARRIHLSEEAYFINATGLDRRDMDRLGMAPASLPGETAITAHDAAIIAQRIVLDHPEALVYASTPVEYLKPGDERYRMQNWNWMLEAWKPFDNLFARNFSYEGLDGLKTGHTSRAGYCFTGTAERGDLRLISVVMGATNERNRFLETKKLLDYGFNSFEKLIVVQPKTELEQMPTVDIKKGIVKNVSVVTEQSAQFLVSKGTKAEDFTITVEPVEEEQRIAPIEKGQILGHVVISLEGSGIPDQIINLVAAEDAEKANWFRLFFRGIGDFFKSMAGSIKNLF